jgi:hypothetical protein
MLCLTMNLKLLLVHKILSGCFIGFSSIFFLCFTEELNESIALHRDIHKSKINLLL